MRFVMAGGGTGGHIYPALAIAQGLKQRYPTCSIIYLGTRQGLEAKLVPEAGLKFHAIRAVGIKRSLTLHNFKVPWEVWAGYRQSKKLLRDFAPQAVIGTGGYVCGPVLLAATRLHIPTLIHEQNAWPGVTNRLLARRVDRVALTFAEALPHFPPQAVTRTVGLPVRPAVIAANRQQARKQLGIKEQELLVLSFGGSQGALTLNTAMAQGIKKLAKRSNLKIIHVTGTAGHEQFMQMLAKQGFDLDAVGNITIKPYLYEMPQALAAADVVICRAGAATLAEITVRGLPALLVPFPYATANHQEHNAVALVQQGAAVMVKDADFTGEVLVSQLEQLISDPDRLQKMAAASLRLAKPQAIDDIINLLEEVL